MRSTKHLLLLVIPLLSYIVFDLLNYSVADDEIAKTPAYIMVTEGIVGGFVPAHVRQRTVIITRDGKHQLFVMKQPARNEPATFHSGVLDDMQYKDLLAAIEQHGLWKLPVESPPGCQDIYKADTSIAISTGDRFWRNGGPAGCVHGESKIQPTEKQIETFRTMVKLLRDTADKQATHKSDEKAYNATVEMLLRDGAKQGNPKTRDPKSNAF